MRGLVLSVALLWPLASAAAVPSPLPSEVLRFIEDRDACDHFGGEMDGYSGHDADLRARQAFVNESIEIYCSGTDRRLAALRSRYRANNAVMDALSKYDSRVEGGR